MPLVDLIAAIDGPEVTSPVSGARGVIIHLEVLEEDISLGEMVIADAVTLHADGKRYVVVARRATFGFVETRQVTPMTDEVPAELVPLLRRSRGGRLFVREHVFRAGDRVRMRAQLDERDAVLVRDDLAPLRLDEAI